MKPELRPIPITLLDFLGALLPGLVWLLLFTATADLAITGTTSMTATWKIASMSLQKSGGWVGPIAVIGGALLIGYSLKPGCMRGAQVLSRYLFKLDPSTREFPSRQMVFPFPVAFGGHSYLTRVREVLAEVMGVSPENEMPGKFPFSAAKRYLKLIAPSLWEESERMEAEVRMTGALFLASIYNIGLTLFVLASRLLQAGQAWGVAGWCWLAGSVVATLVLGLGFNRLRLHEVEYTYMNLLLAEGHWRRENSTDTGGKRKPSSASDSKHS